MPRIVRFYETGGPDVLRIEQTSSRQPGPGEVRIQVKAVGLNRAESMFFRSDYIEDPILPAALGYEASGTIDAVGEDLPSSWLGKRVSTIPSFSMNHYGMLGEEVLAPIHAISEFPSNLSLAEGSAIWMQYFTAYGALVDIAKVTSGDFVLITAASSSVGLAAIEIAKAEGAISIAATRSPGKKEELLSFGADHVITTDTEDIVQRVHQITGGNGARITFDPISGPFLTYLVEATAVDGVLFQYGTLAGPITSFPLLKALAKRHTIHAYNMGEITLNPSRREAGLKYLLPRLADGRLRPRIAKTFPFEQTREAYHYLEANSQVGKVVITF